MKYLHKLAVIENISWAICFTVLSIAFHKWWIVLFAILFMNRVKTNKENDTSKDTTEI